MQNPYALTFGKIPEQIIERIKQKEELLELLKSNPASQQAFIITGVRGSGKTVFMTEILRELGTDPNWVTVELNPERDLLQGLASKLSSETSLARIFKSASINLSVLGLGVEISGTEPITDIEFALTKMLESLKKHNKRVLIAIDEITANQRIKGFIHSFQIFLRLDLPVYLLMTGLYDSIYELQNDKALTFLYRAPKFLLSPLNVGSMANNYAENLKIPRADALEMAKLTKGYSFAFQVLGYLTFRNGGKYKEILPEFKQYLDEYVYEKIWSELSETDKKVMAATARTKSGKVLEIRKLLNYENSAFNPYRSRLIRKGLLNGENYGYLKCTLPLFEEFIEEQ